MHGRKKWWLPVGLILAALVALGLYFREDITALTRALRYSAEELGGKTAQREAVTDEALARLPELGITPLTEEERARLQKGELSEEEALQILLGGETPPAAPAEQTPPVTEAPPAPPAADIPQSTPVADAPPVTAAPQAPQVTAPPQAPAVTETPKPSASASPTPEPEDAVYEANLAQIRGLVAEIYLMRDLYVSKLDGIRDDAAETYRALPADQRTKTTKVKMATQCIVNAKALELECDQKLESILDEMSRLLAEMDWKQSLVSDIRYAYAEEKAQKKAEYMNAYLEQT